jgi:hypothetical protein
VLSNVIAAVVRLNVSNLSKCASKSMNASESAPRATLEIPQRSPRQPTKSINPRRMASQSDPSMMKAQNAAQRAKLCNFGRKLLVGIIIVSPIRIPFEAPHDDLVGLVQNCTQ